MEVKLKDINTGNLIEAVIGGIIETDYKVISANKNYSFDWNLERYDEVYKIVLKSSENEILGLISLTNYPKELRININLLEIGNINQGRKKKIDYIAGCLISYAIRLAFENDYDGFVTLEPKVKLYQHYQDKYGFIDGGYMVLIDGEAAMQLMDKYLE